MLDLKKLTPEFCMKYGVSEWGYTENDIPTSLEHFQQWNEKKHSYPLSYLSDERAIKRESLKSVYPEFQSALSFLFSYTPKDYEGEMKMGHYVFACGGEDYHFILRDRLNRMAKDLGVSEESFKTVLDVEPVLERDLAYRCGLGWFGKNSMLINKKHGSYFLIGSLLFNHKGQSSYEPMMSSDHCGHCTACIEACPTQAIDVNTRTLEVQKCISTFTIELFKPAPAPETDKKVSEIFGCDICQDVCPWNKKILKKTEPLKGKMAQIIEDFFFKRPLEMVTAELENMSNRQFRKKFHGTSLARTGRVGVLKNLKAFF